MNWTVIEESLWNRNGTSYSEWDNHSTTTDPSFYNISTEILQVNLTNFTNTTNQSNRTVSRFYPIIVAEMVLSCLCLIFSLIVYSTMAEFRNVHGKNLITVSSCLLTTFLMLILDLMIRNHVTFSVCFTIAMIIHVTFLGTFFWTNIMAFDIWRSLTNIRAKGEVKSSSRKYLKYSVYSWTATILTALPAAVLELTDWVPKESRPQFGIKRCWLSGTKAFIYYFNLPVGVILFCNLIMFMMTMRKLIIIKKMTAILQVKQQQERLNLYLKLFLVMGIIWTTEFIPWVTGIYKLYALAGMLTALHGVFLFLIFVAKKKILIHFYKRFLSGKKMSTMSQNTSSQQTFSSSNASSKKIHLENMNDSKF